MFEASVSSSRYFVVDKKLSAPDVLGLLLSFLSFLFLTENWLSSGFILSYKTKTFSSNYDQHFSLLTESF